MGVVALGVVDRLHTSQAVESARGEVGSAALVHLQAWPGASVNELSGVVGLSQSATVRLVDRLIEQRFVSRAVGRDRRTVALAVTAEGSRAADAVLADRTQLLKTMLAGLSGEDRQSLARLLSQVTAGLAGDRPEAIRACRLCDRSVCTTTPGCPLEHTTEPGDPRPSQSATR